MINQQPFKHLHLARTSQERTAEDEQATQNLLAAYQDGDGYTCPLCKEHHTDPTRFAEHLTTEANQLFDQITRNGLSGIHKREETK